MDLEQTRKDLVDCRLLGLFNAQAVDLIDELLAAKAEVKAFREVNPLQSEPAKYELLRNGNWIECSKLRYECAPDKSLVRKLYLHPPAVEAKQAVPDEVVTILGRIARWHGEFPQVFNERADRYESYGAAYGSNGERDYMRNLAETALKLMSEVPQSEAAEPWPFKIIGVLEGGVRIYFKNVDGLLADGMDGFLEPREFLYLNHSPAPKAQSDLLLAMKEIYKGLIKGVWDSQEEERLMLLAKSAIAIAEGGE